MTKDFRFGVGLRVAKSLSSVQDAARRAEDLGFDVLHLPDHIGAPAPFPTLMAAAAATKTLRLGTFVLNACFYKPALLARDVQALRDLSEADSSLGWARVMRGTSSRPPSCPTPAPASGSTTWRT